MFAGSKSSHAHKNKQSQQSPSVDALMTQLRRFVPVEPSTADKDELIRAKTKLAEPGDVDPAEGPN